MRKLILAATIAAMSTTSCYANLSLASNESAAATVEQPKAPQPAPIKTPIPEAASAGQPRKAHLRGTIAYPTYSTYRVHSFSRGRCL